MIICLSSFVSSGNFLELNLPLNATRKKDKYRMCELTDEREVVTDVRGENHLCDDLAHVPVLGFRKQFKNVILRVQQKLERNGAVMIFKHRFVIVTKGFRMVHCDQEWIVYATM
jgi:hypothetical protein